MKEWRFRILSNILNTRKINVLGINKHGIKNRFIGSLDKGKKNQFFFFFYILSVEFSKKEIN